MSNKKSMNPIDQDRLRLLSFSPDDKLHHHLNVNKNQSSNLKSDLLYQVYHNQFSVSPALSKVSHRESRNVRKSNLNPQLTKHYSKLVFIDESKANLEYSKIRAKSSHEIKAKKCYMSINVQQNPQRNTTKTISNHLITSSPSKNVITNKISHQNYYTSSKQAFQNLSRQRIEQQKDLTFLSRTFNTAKKSQQQAKQQLISTFTKRMQRQQRQRQKYQAKRKHQQWLQNQKNENSTKKYMNHLMKYHARKNLSEKNSEHAQQLRSRLKSEESVKSQRSLLISQSNKQRAHIMKVEKNENINKAKMRNVSRINQRSNSVRNSMAKVYECEGELEAWRIQQIDERSKFMLATIENTKKNKELLQKVLNDSRHLDSTTLYKKLANNLTQTKTNRKTINK